MWRREWVISIALVGLVAAGAPVSNGVAQGQRTEETGAANGTPGDLSASTSAGGETGASSPPAAMPMAPVPQSRPDDSAGSGAAQPAATVTSGSPAVPVPTPVPAVAPQPPAMEKPVAATAAAADSGRKELRLLARPGAHLAAQRLAIHAPFTTRTGTAVAVQAWPAGGEALPVPKAGAPAWDVAEVAGHAARTACDAGLVERLDPKGSAAGTDQPAIERDTIVDGVTPCSIASAVWASLVVYDRRVWTGQAETLEAAKTVAAKRQKARANAARPAPSALRDVFDVAGYPGKRALRKSPRYLLEMALLADGVAPQEVYRMLAGDDGVRRAFTRLESLRGHIVWVENPAEASRLVTERAAVMAMIYSGRAFQSVAVEGKPLGQIWDGQLYHLDAWVIAKGTPRLEAARAFVDVATAPERQAAQARLFPYGPARASAIAQVGRHPVLNIDMTPHLPTAPANLRNALAFDEVFWERHGAAMQERFEAWLKAPLPQPVAPVVTDGTGKAG